MDAIQQLVLLSEKLYATLEKLEEDKNDKRENQIELIDKLLDARGQTIDALDPVSVKAHKDFKLLQALNEGILQRLDSCKAEIVSDMRQLQVSKKSEERYVNPYSQLGNLDGTYFDKKE